MSNKNIRQIIWMVGGIIWHIITKDPEILFLVGVVVELIEINSKINEQ